ncbi:MAG TPA: SET domain-containing protein-lysine N-methyltransferase [Gemmatimonadaceae bacterium]|nr:SET domain-containing protein-lysine N-methyltransferase [Gemmatimonadaceae bacterium]
MPTRAPQSPRRPRAGKQRAADVAARVEPSPPPSGENRWFELRHSPIQGLGAFAKRDIPRGTRIIEYVGEKISVAESDRRYPDDHRERHHTFLFTLNSKWIVDAAFGGNDARFINHSCAPNCEAVIERGHIWIDALVRIPAGTELSYDYQYEYLDEYTDEDLKFYECRCGAPNCRGTIVAPKPRRRSRKT